MKGKQSKFIGRNSVWLLLRLLLLKSQSTGNITHKSEFDTICIHCSIKSVDCITRLNSSTRTLCIPGCFIVCVCAMYMFYSSVLMFLNFFRSIVSLSWFKVNHLVLAFIHINKYDFVCLWAHIRHTLDSCQNPNETNWIDELKWICKIYREKTTVSFFLFWLESIEHTVL